MSTQQLDEPEFIADARRAVEVEAESRPDADTYREAGHAALNEVYRQWLMMPLFNPHILADERLASLRKANERRMQRQADLLARCQEKARHLEKENERLREVTSDTDQQTGLPLRDALTRARDKVLTLQHELRTASQAILSGSPPVGKKVVNARHEKSQMENLQLNVRVRELENLLKQHGVVCPPATKSEFLPPAA